MATAYDDACEVMEMGRAAQSKNQDCSCSSAYIVPACLHRDEPKAAQGHQVDDDHVLGGGRAGRACSSQGQRGFAGAGWRRLALAGGFRHVLLSFRSGPASAVEGRPGAKASVPDDHCSAAPRFVDFCTQYLAPCGRLARLSLCHARPY
jgi:hypothetical protein